MFTRSFSRGALLVGALTLVAGNAAAQSPEGGIPNPGTGSIAGARPSSGAAAANPQAVASNSKAPKTELKPLDAKPVADASAQAAPGGGAPSGANVASPYSGGAPEATGGSTDTSQGGSKGSGAGMPAGMAGGGAEGAGAGASAAAPNPSAGGAASAGAGSAPEASANAAAGTAGMDAGATAEAPATGAAAGAEQAAAAPAEDKGPNPAFVEKENRASAELRKDQLAKVGNEATMPTAQKPADKPADQPAAQPAPAPQPEAQQPAAQNPAPPAPAPAQ